MNKREKFIYYSSPEHWFQTALELNSSLDELFEILEKSHYYENYHLDDKDTIKRPVTSRAAYLLMTYSLENLLKGIAILRNSDFVNKGKLDNKLKTHDLNILSRLTHFENSKKQNDFQNYLSKLCLSNARYPIGLNENNYIKHPSITKDDYHTYYSLFDKYSQILISEFNLNGWQSGLNNELLDTKPGEFTFVINPNFK